MEGAATVVSTTAQSRGYHPSKRELPCAKGSRDV